jgi:hypothetical protein
MTLNDDAGPYREFAEALLDLVTDKQHSQNRRFRLEKACALIDNRDSRYPVRHIPCGDQRHYHRDDDDGTEDGLRVRGHWLRLTLEYRDRRN